MAIERTDQAFVAALSPAMRAALQYTPGNPARFIQKPALLVLSPCPRMRFVIYLGKMLKIKVGIDLGCADVLVPHKFLDAAQVLA